FWSAQAPRGFRVGALDGYSTLHTQWRSWKSGHMPYFEWADSALCLRFCGAHPDIVIPSDTLLRNLLRQAGVDSSDLLDETLIRTLNDRLLVYRDEESSVVFSEVRFERDSSALRIVDVSVDVVLTR
ncbi:MAG: hypothetical protein K2G66_01145, partial [Alistipes sp.]|nr:hypothetical protein [Alistipes sp.]